MVKKMIFHLSIIGFLTLLATLLFANGERVINKKIYIIFTFIILFFISAFRSKNIGSDTTAYIYLFEYIGTSENIFTLSSLFSINDILESRFEIGYIILNKILFNISDHYIILFIVVSFFVLGAWLTFIYRYSNMIWISVFLFINLRFFYFTLSGLRQAIAMAIILISYKFLKERKTTPFVIVILVASLFHLSALIFLIIYPLSTMKFNKKLLVYSFLSGITIYIIYEVILRRFLTLFPKYNMYLDSTYFDGDIKIATILNFLIVLSIFVFGLLITKKRSDGLNSENKKSNIHLMNHIMLMATLFSFVAINANILNRFSSYFFMFTVVYIPLVIGELKKKEVRVLVTYTILLIAFLYNVIILYYKPDWNIIYPYKFIWEDR
jgi:hypothetical protein